MSEWLLAAVALGSLTLTYFFCVRPMRRGHCAFGGTTMPEKVDTQQTERALEQARAEISRLQREQGVRSSDD